VHGGADAVADVLPHHREARGTDDPFARGTDVAQPSLGPDLLDRGVEGGTGHRDEPLRRLVDAADGHRDRGVGVPALDDRTAVDRHDVALGEHAVTRDPVHDHLVGRDARDSREPVVAEEVGAGVAPFEHLARGEVEVGGRRPRPGRAGTHLVHLGNDAPRGAHVLDLLHVLAQDH